MYFQTVPELNLSVEPGALLLLTEVSQFLTERGTRAYLAGGFVRDMLLGRETADIDIAVDKDALETSAGVADFFGGRYVLLDETNRVGRVVLRRGDAALGDRWELDFSTFGDSIEQDLFRRDFTIDAMAVDLEEFIQQPRAPVLIDPCNGQDDLRRGVIRAVAGTAFPSDPVRLLRAVRLSAELDFSIDKETGALIRHYAGLVRSVAGERVREELLRVLAVPGSGRFLACLAELGLLTAIIPELAETMGVDQPGMHLWDVFNHSLQTVDAVDFLLRRGEWEHGGRELLAAVPWSAELERHFDRGISGGSTGRSLLKLAALLHDVAKPQTRTIDETGRMRFLGHAAGGAAVAAGILERLRFSARETGLVEVLVRYHLRPTQMSQDALPSRRAIYRYFRDAGEAGIDILFLSLADHLATRGRHLDLLQWRIHTRLVEHVLSRYFEEKSLTAPPGLVDGHDLIDGFGLRPGPEIGEILEAVREAQAAGEVTTREEAMNYVARWLASSRAE